MMTAVSIEQSKDRAVNQRSIALSEAEVRARHTGATHIRRICRFQESAATRRKAGLRLAQASEVCVMSGGRNAGAYVLLARGEHCWWPVSEPLRVPYIAGDRLAMREKMVYQPGGWCYAIDDEPVMVAPADQNAMAVWVHHKDSDVCLAQHMPLWACRDLADIRGVRIERLQGISEADCIAAGIDRDGETPDDATPCWRLYDGSAMRTVEPRTSYASLWDSINGRGAWARNDWVVVIELSAREVRS